MSQTITGKAEAVQNVEEIRYSPTDGWSGTWQIEGPKAAVKPLIDQLAALGYNFTYRCDKNPLAQIQYSTIGTIAPGGQETPTLQWEYFANSAEIDVLEVDSANINSISDDNRRIIRSAINNPDATTGPTLTGNSLSLYQLMLGGVRSYRINQPTLRVSKIVSGSYGVKASLTNIGRIISTNTLSLQESIPNTILFELPNYISTKSGFSFGWYKKFPNVQQAGGNRWNISQEWEYGLWAPFLYGSVL